MLHGGAQPIDVYRRIYAGINGTPMPAFKDLLANEPDSVWHLTHYVLDLANQRRRGVQIPLGAPATEPAPAADTPPTAEAATPAGEAAP